jgi:deoxyribodipyrimidine photo-lyase
LLHEDDLDAGWLLARIAPVACALAMAPAARSPLQTAPMVTAFTQGALTDAATRLPGAVSAILPDAPAITAWATATQATEVVTPYAPTGPMADLIRTAARSLAPHGITLTRALRPYDAQLWPHATHGFFRFIQAIRPGIGP